MAHRPPTPEEHDAIRAWLGTFALHVAAVDFDAARPMFAEDAVGFGTFMDVVVGRDDIEAQQWRAVWPTILDFRFMMDGLHIGMAGDGSLAYLVVPFASRGVLANGTRFHRPGRSTLVLTRAAPDAPWQAIHSHFSLNRGVPQVSHGGQEPVEDA